MKNNKKLQKAENEIAKNSVDFSESLRQNILKYAGKNNMTMAELAERADMSINTLNSFIHRLANDTKTTNVAKIAKVFGISMDELVGSDTLHDLTKESLAMCRNLPDNDLYLVRWFIRYLDMLNKDLEPNKRYISVMMPVKTNNGDFKITADYSKLEITDLKEPLRSKIFMGFNIICDHYMPHYAPGDIILVANDRLPRSNEHAVVRAHDYLFIVKIMIENGVLKCYSVRDDKYRINADEISEIMGYIACKKNISGGN